MSGNSPSPTTQDAQADTGPLRIQSVAALTGVGEPTLRAWERRYGIPSPERTATGYRVYRAKDVDQIVRMRRLCDAGVAAAQAAETVRGASSTSRKRKKAATLPVDDVFAASTEAIISAAEAFDDEALDGHLRKLYYVAPPFAILHGVIQPSMVRIGKLWECGDLSVAQEHLVSQKMSQLLRDLIRLGTRAETKLTAILACFPDEEHELPLLGFALHLASWGIQPIFLGARTPVGALRRAVESVQPDLVGLSTTTSIDRIRARELVEDFASACGSVPWIVGGLGLGKVADIVLSNGGLAAPSSVVELETAVLRAVARGGRGTARKRRS